MMIMDIAIEDSIGVHHFNKSDSDVRVIIS